jgi:sugar (pentulose or hexulose) kinase
LLHRPRCRHLRLPSGGHHAQRAIIAEARHPLPAPERRTSGGVEQSPEVWWITVLKVLKTLAGNLGRHRPAALGVDGTSATLLLCAVDGRPLGPALMYNDSRSIADAARIAEVAPAASPAHGASSSLAKLLYLRDRMGSNAAALALHQSDWILGRLSGRFGVSDWNNCLKLGYDPHAEGWPAWLRALDLSPVRLPDVLSLGTPIGRLHREAAAMTGLAPETLVMTRATDSTAAVIAAGPQEPGDAVTSLGSTLVVKILAREPVFGPEHGVYSHRSGNLWLIGGASNSGGAVLRHYFTQSELDTLTPNLDPDHPTGLDYYPLLAPGERFPVYDPHLPARLKPRPSQPLRFFQGMLEGMARIEAAAYRRLAAMGAPVPGSVRTVGGGAANAAWTRIRALELKVPLISPEHSEAAYGAALLAAGRYSP